MGKIAMVLVDKENYVLDGVLYEFPQLDVPLDTLSAEKAVTIYKQKIVDKGIAFGALHSVMEENRNNDMPLEEYTEYALQDPIDAAQALQWDEIGDDEELIHPLNAAFQVLDIMFDPDGKTIVGRIHILDTIPGKAAKANIDADMKCMITQAFVDEILDRDRRRDDGFILRQIIRKVRGGWRMSFEKDVTVSSAKNNT